MKAMEAQSNIKTIDFVSYSDPIATQQTIKAEIKDEKTLVVANRELIARFLQDAKDRLSCIRSDVESAPAEIDE
jgi:hypothetical protein